MTSSGNLRFPTVKLRDHISALWTVLSLFSGWHSSGVAFYTFSYTFLSGVKLRTSVTGEDSFLGGFHSIVLFLCLWKFLFFSGTWAALCLVMNLSRPKCAPGGHVVCKRDNSFVLFTLLCLKVLQRLWKWCEEFWALLWCRTALLLCSLEEHK